MTEEIKREIKNFLETNDNENMTTQNLWDAAKAVKKKKRVYSNIILPQETISNSLTLHLKQLEKNKNPQN